MPSANTVLLTAYFKNLPTDDVAYSRLLHKMKTCAWDMKQDIIAGFDSKVLDYYKFHNKLVDILDSKNSVYSEEKEPTSIDFVMFERFSKDYNLDIDVEVSKAGSYIEEDLDDTSVGYYNLLNTAISGGNIADQSFEHLSVDGDRLKTDIQFTGTECKSVFCDLQPGLVSKISDFVNKNNSRRFELPEITANEPERENINEVMI